MGNSNTPWCLLGFGIVARGRVHPVVLVPDCATTETAFCQGHVPVAARNQGLQVPDLDEVLLFLHSTRLVSTLVYAHSEEELHVKVDDLVDVDRVVMDHELFPGTSFLEDFQVLGQVKVLCF